MRDDVLSPERNALYKAQFNALADNTTEYHDTRLLFEQAIFPNLPRRRHLLDIGAGRGNYAKPFSFIFEQTTIFEPNDVFYQDIMDWSQSAGTSIVGYNHFWQDHHWQDGTTDLVILSHMLYYVDKEQRSAFIRKAYNTLHNGGYLFIALNAEVCGIRDVYHAFYPQDAVAAMPYGEEIAQLLRQENYPHVEEKHLPATISLPNREEAAQLIDFLLLRRVPFDEPENHAKREAFIDEQLLRDGKYLINSDSTLVIVKKIVN